MTEVISAAGVAALAHHGVQPAGGERGELGQGRNHEGQVGVDLAGPQRRLTAHDAGLREHTLDGVAVQVQLAGDGAHAPTFGLVQAQDLRAQFRGYGHGWDPCFDWRCAAVGCDAGSPAAPVLHRACGTTGSAKPVRSEAAPARGGQNPAWLVWTCCWR